METSVASDEVQYRTRIMKAWSAEQQKLYQSAVRIGVPERTAWSIADLELKHWTAEELEAILRRVDGIAPNRPLQSMLPNAANAAKMLGGLLQTAVTGSSAYYRVKPPPEMVARSIVTGEALCVNIEGECSLRRHDYVAISHVWSEGIQGDAQNRGIAKYVIERIFETIRDLKVEYIWLDVVAIPSSDLSLTAKEEMQKVGVINNLDEIYQNAVAVVVLDALLLHMRHSDYLDVAVGLICGKWMTRVWTYPEIKLAKRAFVATKNGLVDFIHLLSDLKAKNNGRHWTEAPSMTDSFQLTNWKKYRILYMQMDLLTRSPDPEARPSLPDIAFSCSRRETSNRIDYVRAFFPVLGLKWQAGWTYEEGMMEMYEGKSNGFWNAARMILMYGRPRASLWPGWAPDRLCGLRGTILDRQPPFTHGHHRLQGNWHTHRILKVGDTPIPRALLLDIRDDSNDFNFKTAGFYCASETESTIRRVKDIIASKTAFLLTFEPMLRRDMEALIVERDGQGSLHKAYVYLVLHIDAISPTHAAPQQSWYLWNENPMNDTFDGGKKRAEAFDYLHQQSSQKLKEQEITPLMDAIHGKDASTVRALLEAGADPNEGNAAFWPLLHAHDNLEITKLLLDHGADPSKTGSTRLSPSMFAARAGNAAVLELLIQRGAPYDLQMTDEQGVNALYYAVKGRFEAVVRLLLHHDADPNVRYGGGWTPLMLAAQNGDVVIADLLIQVGADHSVATTVEGRTALHVAAENGRRAVVKVLREAGADSQCRDNAGFTPGQLARQGNHHAVLGVLG